MNHIKYDVGVELIYIFTLMKTKGFYVETRANDIPWTKEGCNNRENGKFVKWPSKTAAEEAIHERQTNEVEFDDPMWRYAEYRMI